MTVRIGTGSAAVDPSAMRVAGVSPNKIMLGTGAGAIEVWSNTIYPQSGTWPTQAGNSTGYTTHASHTVAESGTYTITLSVSPQGSFATTQARISGPWGVDTGPNISTGSASTVTTTRALSPGGVVNFQASTTASKSGSWSIVKN